MIKTLLLITTCDDNFQYFEKSFQYMRRARDYVFTKGTMDVMIVDFGKDGFKIKEYLGRHVPQTIYLHKPRSSMPNNVNIGMEAAIQGNYDYFFYLNDDLLPHELSFMNAIKFLEENKEVGFVGGAYNQDPWGLPVDTKIEMPIPREKAYSLYNITRLYWEFSCCCLRVEAIKKVGFMDNNFAPPVGYMSDNDYLLRLRQANYETWRLENMVGFHFKGISQIKYRYPGKDGDPMRQQALSYFKLKWGTDISNIDEVITEVAYDKPFNGAKDG